MKTIETILSCIGINVDNIKNELGSSDFSFKKIITGTESSISGRVYHDSLQETVYLDLYIDNYAVNIYKEDLV